MPGLSETENIALRQFRRELAARFGDRLEAVVLFGSRARGEGREDSDLDVLVELRAYSRAERRAVQDLAFDVGYQSRLILSPIIVDPDTWRRDLPLARNIAREGIWL